MLMYVGIPFALLGTTMMVRGWVYTLQPDGAMAQKRKKRNLKVGFTTDMKVFGRKVRRLGLMLLLAGAVMIGFARAEAQDATTTAPTEPVTPTAPPTAPTAPPTTPTPPTEPTEPTEPTAPELPHPVG